MKSALLYFILMGVLSGSLYAQRTDTVSSLSYPDTTRWEYKMETSGESWGRSRERIDYQLFHKYNWKKPGRKNLHTAHTSYYGNGALSLLNDIDEIEIAAAGVTPQNAGEFIYHVVENDSTEIVPWTKPHDFRSNSKMLYAYLGKFNTRNRIVRLEFYSLKHYYDRSIYTFNDLYLPKAQIKWVSVNYNNKYLFRPYQQHFIPDNKSRRYTEEPYYTAVKDSSGYVRYEPFIRKLKKGDISFPWSDSLNHIAVEIKQTLQNDMYNVYLKRMINGKTDTVYVSNDWTLTYYSPHPLLRINASFFNKPGDYEILVVPELPDDFKKNTMDKALAIPFTVLPSGTKAFTSAQVAMIIGSCLLVFGGIFIVYYILHKRKLAREAQQKEIARLQLQSVRSQLNPHFMFNALAGIQNLMNKNDVDATNSYLNKFARLTRHVLEDKQDMTTIGEECVLLETYLQMEQMRFGFKYDIRVDEGIDAANGEIPAMLLQPFVENAVKHGVSALKENGQISIRFKMEEDALLIEIKDNGCGFADERNPGGNGTRLSQQRIDLLNRLHKENPISLHKKSGLTGTTISIQLKGYLHAVHDH